MCYTANYSRTKIWGIWYCKNMLLKAEKHINSEYLSVKFRKDEHILIDWNKNIKTAKQMFQIK